MAMADEATQTCDPEDQLLDAIASFEAALDAGLPPDPAAWLARYPAVAGRLAAYFAGRDLLPALVGPLLAPAAAPPAGLPRPFGEYELLEEVGRGGMGVVYKARQVRLNRLIALKVILGGGHTSADERVRFRAEAEAVGRLQHPHIVQVHDVGEHEGLPYLALELCPGGNLAARLNGTPVLPAEAARLVEQLARAVHAAHQAQVVHRDLKPANVLLAADGTPKVSDFGLAKRLDATGATATGAIVGTPSYMAPEQAQGRSKEVGPACDVYALGAILYECLTGRPPFKAATTADTLLQVVRDEPVAVRRLQPGVPRDLETICLKCLHKQPQRRYASAEELAGRLRLVLEGRPIPDRPAGRTERLWRWCRRNPLPAGMAGVALVLLLVILVGAPVAVLLLAEERATALANLAAANSAREKTREELARVEMNRYALQIAFAQQLIAAGEYLRAEKELEKCPPALRHFEYYHLLATCRGAVRVLHRASGFDVAFPPDGKQVAAAAQTLRRGDQLPESVVKVWDVTTGKEISSRKGRLNCSLAFHRDGRLVTFSGAFLQVQQVELTVVDPTGGRDPVSIQFNDFGEKESKDLLPRVTVSPDGRWAATSYLEGDPARRLRRADDRAVVRIWDLSTLKTKLEFNKATGPALFSPTGKLLAFGNRRGEVTLRELATGNEALKIRAGRAGAFSPDGQHLVTVDIDSDESPLRGKIKIWDLRTGKERLLANEAAWSVAFSPDGKDLALGGQGVVRLLDAATGQEKATWQTESEAVLGLAFSPDRRFLAVAGFYLPLFSKDRGEVKLLSTRPTATRVLAENAIHDLIFSPDSRWLVVVSIDGEVRARVWDAKTGLERGCFVVPAKNGPVGRFLLSHDGNTLTCLYEDGPERSGFVQSWDFQTGRRLSSRRAEPADIKPFDRFARDQRLAILGKDGNLTNGKVTADGKRRVEVPFPDTLKLWDVPTGEEVFTLRVMRRFREFGISAALSPDGNLLAIGRQDGVHLLSATPFSFDPPADRPRDRPAPGAGAK
jgi:eukaryotic-like serine/threonine-protein kinase